MTAVDVFRCKGCGLHSGPFGTHGYDAKSGTGELMGVCVECKKLAVVKVEKGEFTSGCRCGAAYKAFDGACPKCGSDRCGFEPMGGPISGEPS